MSSPSPTNIALYRNRLPLAIGSARLDDPDEYARASRAARARAAATDPAQELHDFEASLARRFGRPSEPRPTDLAPRP